MNKLHETMDNLATNIPKIMVVDDDFSVRNLVHRFLSRKYKTEAAADGK
ncbi:MAG: DNA-binding response regulator, partial [Cylindrospermopsis raciborskii]